jgi:DNA-directed RNA polymerase subunit M/transcription elongation factor TFIIS
MAHRPHCPKCGGNLFASEDVYSAYLHCLQCGYARETTPLGSLDEELEATLRPYRARLGLTPERATLR